MEAGASDVWVAFRYITGDEHPDHDTIANFRKRFLGELEGLFKQVLEIGGGAGHVPSWRLSLDGTKPGSAAMSWGHANKLERQLEGEVQRLMAQQADQEAEAEQQELHQSWRRGTTGQRSGTRRRRSKSARKSGMRWSERRREVKRRQEREAATGKMGGKPPKEPASRTERQGPSDSRMKNHGSCRARKETSYRAATRKRWWSAHLVVAAVSQAANDKREIERVEEGRRRTGQAGSAGGGCRVPQQGKRGAVRGTGHRAVYRGQPGTHNFEALEDRIGA